MLSLVSGDSLILIVHYYSFHKDEFWSLVMFFRQLIHPLMGVNMDTLILEVYNKKKVSEEGDTQKNFVFSQIVWIGDWKPLLIRWERVAQSEKKS